MQVLIMGRFLSYLLILLDKSAIYDIETYVL
jgi:hypothetical protein